MPDDRAAEQLIAAKIQAGNFDAEVEAWIRRFIKKAMAMALRWGHSYADAEDLVGDFLLVLWRNRLKTYRPEDTRLFTYCFAIFRHVFYHGGSERAEELRGTVPIEPTFENDDVGIVGVVLVSSELSAEQVMISEQDRLALERSVNALPPAAQRLIREVLIGRTPADIARDLGISPGTTRVRICRALKNLRRIHTESLNRVAN